MLIFLNPVGFTHLCPEGKVLNSFQVSEALPRPHSSTPHLRCCAWFSIPRYTGLFYFSVPYPFSGPPYKFSFSGLLQAHTDTTWSHLQTSQGDTAVRQCGKNLGIKNQIARFPMWNQLFDPDQVHTGHHQCHRVLNTPSSQSCR